MDSKLKVGKGTLETMRETRGTYCGSTISSKSEKKGSADTCNWVIEGSFGRSPCLHCTRHTIAKSTTAASKKDSMRPDATPERLLVHIILLYSPHQPACLKHVSRLTSMNIFGVMSYIFLSDLSLEALKITLYIISTIRRQAVSLEMRT